MKILRLLILLFTFSLLLFPFAVSAGTIRKPPNNLNMVGYWPMDEGNGTIITDHTGNNRNGNLSSANTPSWISGKRGKALSFSGTAGGNQITYTGIASLTTTYTVAFWIYPIPVASSNYQTIFTNNCGSGIYYISGSGANARKINLYGDNGDNYSATRLTENQWNHVVVVDNANSVTFYINGVAGGTVSGSIGIFIPNITGNDICAETFKGSLDDLRAYRGRALSATEVAYLYQSGATKLNVSSTPSNLLNGLTAWWTFDGKDMVNNVSDISGNARNGVLVNYVSTTTTAGKMGQALKFAKANNNYVDTNLANSNFITASDGTISAWVRPTGTAPSVGSVTAIYSGAHAVGSSFTGGSFGITRANLTGFGDLIFGWNFPSGGKTVVGVAYNPDEWIHITWVHTGGVLSLYKNGVFATSTTSGNTSSGFSGNFLIGNDWAGLGGTTFWNGDIDDVRTWSRALTATEIAQLYSSTIGVVGNKTSTPTGSLQTGLAGHWTFDGGDINWNTNTVTNKAGTCCTGTFFNMSTSSSPTPGKIGQALNFVAGSSQYVDVNSTNAIKPGTNVSFTVSLWYKGAGTGTKDFVTGGMSPGNYWYIGESDSLFFSNSESSLGTQVTYTLPGDNGWHHLVIVLDRAPSPDTVTAYIDGVSQGSGSETMDGGSASGSGNNRIGRGNWINPTTYRDGPIDDVRIYNRALSASEVKQLYLVGK